MSRSIVSVSVACTVLLLDATAIVLAWAFLGDLSSIPCEWGIILWCNQKDRIYGSGV
ncbi:hypothetical protein [Paenibacillus sp. RC21]|uniref:hypothetical protein n=1 Tax=Paenibacillus sp. RC21 TaxID=3156312 RepID=UPI0038349AE8